MSTFVSRFKELVKRFPKRNALWIEDRFYSYEELDNDSNRLASFILRSPGNTVVLLCEKSYIFYAAMLACLKSGKAFIPANSTHSIDQIHSIITMTSSKLLIVCPQSESIVEKLRKLIPDIVQAYDSSFQNGTLLSSNENGPIQALLAKDLALLETTQKDWDVHPDQNAYIFSTSGSTGKPKFVPISHKNLLAYLESADLRYVVNEEDRFTQISSITFDVSIQDILFPWYKGACTYSVTNQYFDLVSFVQKHKLTFWTSVPSISRMIIQMKTIKPGCLSSLRNTMWVGEPLTASILHEWKLGAPNSVFENMYGPTEATVGITGYRCSELTYEGFIPIGIAYKDQKTKIVDSDLAETTTGELLLAGTQVFNGYLNNAEATSRCFVNLPNDDKVWYRTGDLVKKEENGVLHFIGRIDKQLKINGYRLERSEVEERLRLCCKCEMVAVLPLKNREGIVEGLAAFIDGSHLTKTEIRARFKDYMPPHMWPIRLEFKKIPLNRNHKTDHKALEELLYQDEPRSIKGLS